MSDWYYQNKGDGHDVNKELFKDGHTGSNYDQNLKIYKDIDSERPNTSRPTKKFKFIPIHDKGIYSLHNVCIELNYSAPEMWVTPNHSQTARVIVVYNSKENSSGDLEVERTISANFQSWPLTSRTTGIPHGHTYIYI